jgi:hypothetical protein
VKQFHLIPVVVTKDNELIPITDSRLSFEKGGYSDDCIVFEDNSVHRIVQCQYDLVTKQLVPAVVLEYRDDNNFEIGEQVCVDKRNRTVVDSKIVDIQYRQKDYDLYDFVKGDKVSDYKLKQLGTLDADTIYCIKTLDPYYVLENGEVVREREMYHKK